MLFSLKLSQYIYICKTGEVGMVVWSPPTPLDNSTQSLVQVFIAGPVDGFDQGETH